MKPTWTTVLFVAVTAAFPAGQQNDHPASLSPTSQLAGPTHPESSAPEGPAVAGKSTSWASPAAPPTAPPALPPTAPPTTIAAPASPPQAWGDACVPPAYRCQGPQLIFVCNAGHTWELSNECPADQKCIDIPSGPHCVSPVGWKA